MVAPIRTTTAWQHDDKGNAFDAIIDVRSPSEFADDHIPGAINLPVLNDEERAEVGTIYKQVSPFKARQLGAQYVSRNIAQHLEELKARKADWRPLVYCWRGGQRSGSMARILAEIGWVTTLLEGGYKTYREQVMNSLAERSKDLKLVLLQGPTGSAKTHILNAAQNYGVQVIDLEDLAAHRGSLLGAEPGQAQPSQRWFESQIAQIIAQLDLNKPILVEAESSRIGNCYIPQGFWQMMHDAPQIHINASIESRVEFLIRDYPHLIADPQQLDRLIDGMVNRHGYEVTASWRALAEAKDWSEFVKQLITQHYDPAYKNSSARKDGENLGEIVPKTLDQREIDAAAGQIPKILAGLNAKK